MKKTICISGKLVFPIKEGSQAIIAHKGGFIRTSRVVEIFEENECIAHFETMNSIYKVSYIPLSISSPLPEDIIKCA